MKYSAVLNPGDGIGPEITAAVRAILEAAGAGLEWIERQAGVTALEREGDVLPQSTLEAIGACKLALKGPCTTPVRSLPGVHTRFEDVDLVIVNGGYQ